jgi:hypothetical protein
MPLIMTIIVASEQATRTEIEECDVENVGVSVVSCSHWSSSELRTPGAHTSAVQVAIPLKCVLCVRRILLRSEEG